MYKALDKWLGAYLTRPRDEYAGPKDLLLCICDHFEPLHKTDKLTALERVDTWRREFPKLADEFRDADGVPLRWTFFYPIEQYDPKLVDKLGELCSASGAEVEIHLHHENDTPEGLAGTLEQGKLELAGHGLLCRDEHGQTRFGFIHGNWALDNSHPRRRFCGVSNELQVLLDRGCYADFTMPAAPDNCQTRIINRIYYAAPGAKPKSHNQGEPAAAGKPSLPDRLLMVQGPLGLNWERRKWGILPHLENGELAEHNPPRPDRLRLWTRLGIHVQGRPEWVFVKLHTHGALPGNFQTLLGEPMREFCRHLREKYTGENGWRVHFVSSRELVNIVHAAEAGETGNPAEFRNYRYVFSQETS